MKLGNLFIGQLDCVCLQISSCMVLFTSPHCTKGVSYHLTNATICPHFVACAHVSRFVLQGNLTLKVDLEDVPLLIWVALSALAADGEFRCMCWLLQRCAFRKSIRPEEQIPVIIPCFLRSCLLFKLNNHSFGLLKPLHEVLWLHLC